jgi:glucokinase
VVTPNLPWVVDAHELARDLKVPSVRLLNDLEANAYGIAALDAQDFVTLNPGAPGATGNAAVISVGTGLGEAGLFWNGETHLPFACEGGHADFAPRNALEAELMLWLQARHGRVSYERVLSGPGLLSIYEFLRDTGKGSEAPELREALRQGDGPAAISAAGLEGRDALCVKALDLFVSLYGAEAGNLALKVMATGGVYIGGGIAPKILKKLQAPAFLEAFADKGRMRPLLEAMPVKVITKDTAALLGAARVAAMSCS